MKTYIFYYEENDITYSWNLKAQDNKEAYEIAEQTGMYFMGEKIEEVEVDSKYKNWLNLTHYQQEFINWFRSLDR